MAPLGIMTIQTPDPLTSMDRAWAFGIAFGLLALFFLFIIPCTCLQLLAHLQECRAKKRQRSKKPDREAAVGVSTTIPNGEFAQTLGDANNTTVQADGLMQELRGRDSRTVPANEEVKRELRDKSRETVPANGLTQELRKEDSNAVPVVNVEISEKERAKRDRSDKKKKKKEEEEEEEEVKKTEKSGDDVEGSQEDNNVSISE